MRLKDWLKTGTVYALAAIGGSLLYGMMMYMMGFEGSFSDLLNMAVLYLLMFGAFMSMVLVMTVYKQNLPLALSFGSTRKEAFWGVQCYRIVYMLLVMAVAAVLALLTGDEGAAMAAVYVPLGFAAMLILGAIGSAAGIVGIRYGKGAAIVVGVFMGILSCGLGFGSVMWMKKRMTIDLSNWALWLFVAIGLLLHIVSMVLEYKTIYKYNVKL